MFISSFLFISYQAFIAYSADELLTQVTYRVGIVLILYASAAVTISLYAGPVTTI